MKREVLVEQGAVHADVDLIHRALAGIHKNRVAKFLDEVLGGANGAVAQGHGGEGEGKGVVGRGPDQLLTGEGVDEGFKHQRDTHGEEFGREHQEHRRGDTQSGPRAVGGPHVGEKTGEVGAAEP